MATSSIPVVVQTPQVFAISIGNGDASAWKFLTPQTFTNTNGTKVVSAVAASSDSSARVVQLAALRSTSGVTVTLASPGVFTWPSAHGLVAGDQVIFSTTGALPTGLTAGTTYFVIAAGLTSTQFEVSTTAGGSAVNTSVSQSGTHTGYIVRVRSSASVAITAGTDGATAATDLISATLCPGLAADNDGQKYLFLQSGDFLAVSAVTTVTANKIINIHADAANF